MRGTLKPSSPQRAETEIDVKDAFGAEPDQLLEVRTEWKTSVAFSFQSPVSHIDHSRSGSFQ